MSASNATVTPTNIPLGPMRVSFKGTQVGGTTDSVKISKKLQTADKMIDQFGKTSVDKVVSGYDYQVEFVLAEVKNKDLWKVVFPSDYEVTSGTKTIVSTMNIGDSLYAQAGALLLHPLYNVDGNLTEDYTFEKAASIETSEVVYGPDKQTGLKVTFHIFPNLSTTPARLMIYGDPSNGLVAAIAGNAAAGANTGNGDITLEAAFSGVTKTETLTILCLDADGSGNNFSVTGSLSGALGVFNVGDASGDLVNFVPTTGSPQVVTFRLTQGSVQFVAGDSFTMAMTASNYV